MTWNVEAQHCFFNILLLLKKPLSFNISVNYLRVIEELRIFYYSWEKKFLIMVLLMLHWI